MRKIHDFWVTRELRSAFILDKDDVVDEWLENNDHIILDSFLNNYYWENYTPDSMASQTGASREIIDRWKDPKGIIFESLAYRPWIAAPGLRFIADALDAAANGDDTLLKERMRAAMWVCWINVKNTFFSENQLDSMPWEYSDNA